MLHFHDVMGLGVFYQSAFEYPPLGRPEAEC